MKEDNKITFELPIEITNDLSDKIVESMKQQYYWGVTQKISDKLTEKLTSDGMLDEIVEKVYDKLKVDEEEFTTIIANDMKESLMSCMGTIASKTVEKVQEKIDSYGFIKIGKC